MLDGPSQQRAKYCRNYVVRYGTSLYLSGQSRKGFAMVKEGMLKAAGRVLRLFPDAL